MVCDDAREGYPFFPAATKRIHRSLDDPVTTAGGRAARLAVFRRVRDARRARLAGFALTRD
jgi:arsenate reductase